MRSRICALLLLALTSALLGPFPAAAATVHPSYAGFFWDGGGTTNNMTEAANWSNDVAPSPGDGLAFPTSAARHNIVNDYPSGTSFASINLVGDTFSFTGNAITALYSVAAFGTNTFAQTVTFGDGSVIVGTGSVRFASGIAGSGTVTKSDTSTAVFEGASTHSGTLVGEQGSIRVDGTYAGSIRLLGAKLSGSGTVDRIDDRSTSGDHAELSPGGFGTAGRLTVSDVTAYDGDTLRIDIGGTTPGTQYDQLRATSHSSFWEMVGGNLQPSVLDVRLVNGFVPSPGDQFRIVDNAHNGYSDGWFLYKNQNDAFVVDGVIFRVDYYAGDGNDVVLTVLAAPTVSIADKTVAEPEYGTEQVQVNVSLSAPAAAGFSVDVATSDVSATANRDYLPYVNRVDFFPGEQSKVVDLYVLGDSVSEDVETFEASLSNSTLSNIADADAVVTISDDPTDVTGGRVQKVVAPGATVKTGDHTSISDPFQVSLTTPVGGAVDAYEDSLSAPLPEGFSMLGYTASIDGAPATVTDPMVTRARFHSTYLPKSLSQSVQGLTVFRDLVELPACSAPGAVPDACVASRSVNGSELEIAVRSASSGTYRFGYLNPPPPPPSSTTTTTPTPAAPPAPTGDEGYWMVGSDGGVFSYGDARFYGSTGNIKLNKPVVNMARTPSNNGYWMVATDGGIFAYGDAGFYGSTGSMKLNQPIIDMARTPSGKGYWLVASDGGIFAFGDAGFYGSTGAMRLNQPIVDMTSTPSGKGYWLVASDGGVFAFGDAAFYGSTGAMKLNQPIVSMGAKPDGGYWLVAADGGVFSFGAGFYGAVHGPDLTAPIVSIRVTASGNGYWLVGRDGSMFSFGNAVFRGSARGLKLNSPIVGLG